MPKWLKIDLHTLRGSESLKGLVKSQIAEPHLWKNIFYILDLFIFHWVQSEAL